MQNDGGVVISSSPSSGSFSAPTDASPVRQFFRSKWVRLILVLDVIAIIAVIVFVIFNQTKTAIINFSVAPVDATITMNGQGNYHNGSYQVHPGTYDVTISHDGLDPKTFTLELKPDYSTTLTAFLKGENNNFDFYTYRANYDSLQQLIQIANNTDNTTTDQDLSAEQFVTNFQRIMSISESLPIKSYVYAASGVNASTAGFTIKEGRGQDGCEKTACLLVNYYGKDYEEAVAQKIKEAGYNPGDYQIIYERYSQ